MSVHHKKVRWAENVVENSKLPSACSTPPLAGGHGKHIRFSSADPKVEELHHFLKVHEPSRLDECEDIVAMYRKNGRVEFLMCDMKAHYGCCSRRCRLCASGAMDEDALLHELAQCGPVDECGNLGDSYTGDDLEALLVMCGGLRDSLSSACDGCGSEPETPFMHHHRLSRDSSLSSACSLSSASSSPVLRSDHLWQKPEKFYSSSGSQGDSNSPPLMQYRRMDHRPAVGSSSPVLEFRRRDMRAESDPFDEFDFGDFNMH